MKKRAPLVTVDPRPLCDCGKPASCCIGPPAAETRQAFCSGCAPDGYWPAGRKPEPRPRASPAWPLGRGEGAQMLRSRMLGRWRQGVAAATERWMAETGFGRAADQPQQADLFGGTP